MTAGLSIPLPSNASLNFSMVNPALKKQSALKTSVLSFTPCNKKYNPLKFVYTNLLKRPQVSQFSPPSNQSLNFLTSQW